MKLRIRFWPRRVLTLAGRPDPAAVRVELLGGEVAATTTRLASGPGFMVLLVRYPTEGTKPRQVLTICEKPHATLAEEDECDRVAGRVTRCLQCGNAPVDGVMRHTAFCPSRLASPADAWGTECPTSPCEGPACPACNPRAGLRCPYCNGLDRNHSADCGSAAAGRVLTEHRCVECDRQYWHRVGCTLWPYKEPDWLCPWTPNCDGSAACVNHGQPRCFGCGEIADGHGSSCTM